MRLWVYEMNDSALQKDRMKDAFSLHICFSFYLRKKSSLETEKVHTRSMQQNKDKWNDSKI